MADVLTFDEHVRACEPCRRAGFALGTASTRGLVLLTREGFARRSATWQALCADGRRVCEIHWDALGLGRPDYAQDSVA